MEEAFAELLAELGVGPGLARPLFHAIARPYRSPGRHYHNLDHVAAVLRTVHDLWEAPPPALRLATWFHDVAYETQRADNEERSAELARALLGDLSVAGPIVDETARLILLTRTHQTTDDDRAGQVLLDADLAILGANEAEYARYARAIRQEYAWVADEAYRAGRRRVLEGFLRRPRLYFTEAMFRKAEAMARDNLEREIQSLSA